MAKNNQEEIDRSMFGRAHFIKEIEKPETGQKIFAIGEDGLMYCGTYQGEEKLLQSGKQIPVKIVSWEPDNI